MVKTLAELTATGDPAIDQIREWVAAAENECRILPPSPDREAVLLEVQVTTHSTMGAVAYETGGILIDHGWLRFLGSGHPRLIRTLPGWNRNRSSGFYLIADDAVGGFFAMNGGAFGEDRGNVYYCAPDDLEWMAMGFGYTDLLHWSLTKKLGEFYTELRWPKWQDDVAQLAADKCFWYFPPLWMKEGSLEGSHRGEVPVAEAFASKVTLLEELWEQVRKAHQITAVSKSEIGRKCKRAQKNIGSANPMDVSSHSQCCEPFRSLSH